MNLGDIYAKCHAEGEHMVWNGGNRDFPKIRHSNKSILVRREVLRLRTGEPVEPYTYAGKTCKVHGCISCARWMTRPQIARMCPPPSNETKMKIANTVRAKPVAKLSMEIAREIRRLRVEKKLTHDEIAMAYKIDRSLSSAICRNKAWVEYHKITTIPRRPGKYEVSVTSGVITGDWLNRVNPPRGGV